MVPCNYESLDSLQSNVDVEVFWVIGLIMYVAIYLV